MGWGRLSVFVLIALLCLHGRAATAQESIQRVRELHSQGEDLTRKKRFDEAAGHLARAYLLSMRPVLLFGTAVALRGQYAVSCRLQLRDDAIQTFERFTLEARCPVEDVKSELYAPCQRVDNYLVELRKEMTDRCANERPVVTPEVDAFDEAVLLDVAQRKPAALAAYERFRREKKCLEEVESEAKADRGLLERCKDAGRFLAILQGTSLPVPAEPTASRAHAASSASAASSAPAASSASTVSSALIASNDPIEVARAQAALREIRQAQLRAQREVREAQQRAQQEIEAARLRAAQAEEAMRTAKAEAAQAQAQAELDEQVRQRMKRREQEILDAQRRVELEQETLREARRKVQLAEQTPAPRPGRAAIAAGATLTSIGGAALLVGLVIVALTTDSSMMAADMTSGPWNAQRTGFAVAGGGALVGGVGILLLYTGVSARRAAAAQRQGQPLVSPAYYSQASSVPALSGVDLGVRF